MKQKKIGDILYVYSTTAYEITEDTDATVIKIQEECIPAYAALNASLVSKFSPINYKLFCVIKPEWADYMNDYTVTIDTITGGTVTASPTSGDEGEEITLTQEASTGYEFVYWAVASADSVEVEVTDNKFLMPASNVTVNAQFDKIDFDITVDDQIQNGSLSAPETANLGDTVTITATPAAGYVLDTLTVMCGSLEITVVNSQFTMPAGDVTVTGTFRQAVVPYEQQYFTIESEADNNEITIKQESSRNTFYVSIDNGETWEASTTGGDRNISISKTLDEGDKLLVKSQNNMFSKWLTPDSVACGAIDANGSYKVYGNIMSLLYGDNFVNQTSFPVGASNNFEGLFINDSYLTDVSNLILPATTLTESCYSYMFSDCTALTATPVLPATTLVERCYEQMFNRCTALTATPVLPATTLANYCYLNMFNGCTSLTTITATGPSSYPVALPATTLADYCYNSMFNNCTRLNTVPGISATTLASNCCGYMFNGCTSLTTAPELLATTSATSCYSNMFKGCTSLNEVTMLLEDIPTGTGSLAPDFLAGWLYNCSNTGTLYVSSNLTSSQKDSLIFALPGDTETLWTIEDYIPAS